MSKPTLDEILDAHAETYARATMDYITGKLTEDERDKEFHHSDLKTKKALLRREAHLMADIIGAEVRIDTVKADNIELPEPVRDFVRAVGKQSVEVFQEAQRQRAKERGIDLEAGDE